MKESTRQLKKQRKHDETLALLLGITYEEVLANREKEERDDLTREAQAIHLFLERPDAFVSKVCDECKALFMTSYSFVSLCSTACRITSLERMGIDWNPMRTATERWKRAQIPVGYQIPPAALDTLLLLAKEQQENMADCGTPEENVPYSEPVIESQNIEQLHTDPLVSLKPELLDVAIGPEEDYLL